MLKASLGCTNEIAVRIDRYVDMNSAEFHIVAGLISNMVDVRLGHVIVPT